jgi:hypothetical protein
MKHSAAEAQPEFEPIDRKMRDRKMQPFFGLGLLHRSQLGCP